MKTKPGFSITKNKGFHITFDNGVCVSVQFGRGNYADNYNLPIGDRMGLGGLESTMAEVAIWNNQDPRRGSGFSLTKKCPHLRLQCGSSDVAGYVSPRDVAKAIAWASKQKVKE